MYKEFPLVESTTYSYVFNTDLRVEVQSNLKCELWICIVTDTHYIYISKDKHFVLKSVIL
jgi:hypothetical protein